MTEIVKTRDVVTIVKGETNPVVISAAMALSGWVGGQAVVWENSPNDEFLVTYSDGTYGGFLLWGSNESSDQFVSTDGAQTKYKFATLCSGTWVIATKTFEQYTWTSRQAGPLVPIVYTTGERLRFSLRGYFTNEDEWTSSGDPRGSNQFFIGVVARIPTVDSSLYMTIQTSI